MKGWDLRPEMSLTARTRIYKRTTVLPWVSWLLCFSPDFLGVRFPFGDMFSRNLLAYALFFLSLFQLGLVSARPQFQQYKKRDAASPDALQLRTNAARMAAGYTPLKPRYLYTPTRIGTRLRFLRTYPLITTSSCPTR